jgi:hypothetical protein
VGGGVAIPHPLFGGRMPFGITERKKGVWVLREMAPKAAHDVRISSSLLRLADQRGNYLAETSQRTVSPLPAGRQLMLDDPAGTIRLKSGWRVLLPPVRHEFGSRSRGFECVIVCYSAR